MKTRQSFEFLFRETFMVITPFFDVFGSFHYSIITAADLIILNINQIKEKSERSLPMSGRASFDSGGNYVDGQMSFTARRQSNLTPSRGGSRPPSRTGKSFRLNCSVFTC